MIHDNDRAGYFGASDTRYVVAKNRNTKSWVQWWETKLGNMANHFSTRETEAGNRYEHPILQVINENMDLDGQIIHHKYPIRVNYDGYIDGKIYEIKTHHAEKEFRLVPAYWMQSQVEMYVYQEMCSQWFLPPFESLYVVSYGLYPDEYDLFGDNIVIDEKRLVYHPVAYDKSWIKSTYLPNVKELARALKREKFPG